MALARRDWLRLIEFVAKAEYLAREIAEGRFYKRPGKWFPWCDFLPACVEDKQKIKATLVKIDGFYARPAITIRRRRPQ